MNIKQIILTYITLLVFCCIVAAQNHYTLKTGTFGNGAAAITDSSNYQLLGTAGQTITGQSENNDYFSNAGFWFQSYFTLVGVEDIYDNLPKTFRLDQNYPNPFNPVTTIKYAVPKTAHIRLEVYNALGQKVAILVDDRKSAGYYNISFNATHLASGLYFYRMYSNDFTKVKKLMLLK